MLRNRNPYLFSASLLLFFGKRYKWDKNEKHLKPETGLLQLRKGLKVFANLRPATVLPQVQCFLLFTMHSEFKYKIDSILGKEPSEASASPATNKRKIIIIIKNKLLDWL